jgi:hypothetical protein
VCPTFQFYGFRYKPYHWEAVHFASYRVHKKDGAAVLAAERFLFGVDALDRPAPLVRRERRFPAELGAVRHGARPAFGGACADQVARSNSAGRWPLWVLAV